MLASQIEAAFNMHNYEEAIVLADSLIPFGAMAVSGLVFGRYSANAAKNWEAELRFLDAQYQGIIDSNAKPDYLSGFSLDKASYSKQREALMLKMTER
ncbi:MAG: hypothetical protein IPP40_17755 [bacterium]|nr:hypothetical protein [bacterium]